MISSYNEFGETDPFDKEKEMGALDCKHKLSFTAFPLFIMWL